MHDIPGVSCGCGDPKTSERRDDGAGAGATETCPECRATLEWKLRPDGITKHV